VIHLSRWSKWTLLALTSRTVGDRKREEAWLGSRDESRRDDAEDPSRVWRTEATAQQKHSKTAEPSHMLLSCRATGSLGAHAKHAQASGEIAALAPCEAQRRLALTLSLQT
jgi:hypothetical protein